MDTVKQTTVEILKNAIAITAVDMSGANNLLNGFVGNPISNVIANGYTLSDELLNLFMTGNCNILSGNWYALADNVGYNSIVYAGIDYSGAMPMVFDTIKPIIPGNNLNVVGNLTRATTMTGAKIIISLLDVVDDQGNRSDTVTRYFKRPITTAIAMSHGSQ